MAGRSNDPMTSEAYGSKNELQSLNSQLAEYIRGVREMRLAAVRNVGPQHYFSAMENMESELLRMRGAYEAELDRLRNELKDANARYQTACNTIEADRKNYQNAAMRIEELEREADALRQEVASLRAQLASRDGEAAQHREEISKLSSVIARYKDNQARSREAEGSAERRLADETQRRCEAEENANQLIEKLSFAKRQHEMQEKELQERLKGSQKLIAMLDAKLGSLSQMSHDQLQTLLQRVRDMTAQDLRNFHQQTEESLNKTIGTLKHQMEEEGREKQAIHQDRQALQSLAGGLDETNKNLQAQIRALQQQCSSLQSDLRQERENNNVVLQDHEQRYRALQEELMAKAREFAQAREAQMSLKAEMGTYRELIQGEAKDAARMPAQQIVEFQSGGRASTLPQPRLMLQASESTETRPNRPPAGVHAGNARHWGTLKDSRTGPFQPLPAIGTSRSQMDGILDTSRSEPPLQNMKGWNQYQTTYRRMYSPNSRFGRRDLKLQSWR